MGELGGRRGEATSRKRQEGGRTPPRSGAGLGPSETSETRRRGKRAARNTGGWSRGRMLFVPGAGSAARPGTCQSGGAFPLRNIPKRRETAVIWVQNVFLNVSSLPQMHEVYICIFHASEEVSSDLDKGMLE